MAFEPQFLFATCQVGAEQALKREVAARWPDLRFAFSRPGFLTFKLPATGIDANRFQLQATFARAWGFVIGKAEGDSIEARSQAAWNLVGDQPFDQLHVWPRDRAAAGYRGYQPAPTNESFAAALQLSAATERDLRCTAELRRLAELPAMEPVSSGDYATPSATGGDNPTSASRGAVVSSSEIEADDEAEVEAGDEADDDASLVDHEVGEESAPPRVRRASAVNLDPKLRMAAEAMVARSGDWVLDCILVEPNLWWIGAHRASERPSCWAGGMQLGALPPGAVSRAYLKMVEGLEWSGLPIKPGDRCAELGCSPGGGAQALLERDLEVTGIDPALVDDSVLEHPKFTHLRKRGADVRRREFRKTRWLMSDMNVAPSYTLDTVEAIVLHPEVEIRGLLLTLKLPDWQLAAELPLYLERVRSWGFAQVSARQLLYNRQEVCVSAMRRISR